jgi:hypothetical protein
MPCKRGGQGWNLVAGKGSMESDSYISRGVSSHLLAQRPQCIGLMGAELRPATHTSISDLAKPLGTIARRIDMHTSAGNSPTAVQRLQAGYDANEISADR